MFAPLPISTAFLSICIASFWPRRCDGGIRNTKQKLLAMDRLAARNFCSCRRDWLVLDARHLDVGFLSPLSRTQSVSARLVSKFGRGRSTNLPLHINAALPLLRVSP